METGSKVSVFTDGHKSEKSAAYAHFSRIFDKNVSFFL